MVPSLFEVVPLGLVLGLFVATTGEVLCRWCDGRWSFHEEPGRYDPES